MEGRQVRSSTRRCPPTEWRTCTLPNPTVRAYRVTTPPPRTQECVYIKRAGDASFVDEAFARLEISDGDTVGILAESACRKFPRWGLVDAGQIRLFLVADAGADQPSVDAIDLIIDNNEKLLQVNKRLSEAGVASSSWLVARVTPHALPAGARALVPFRAPRALLTPALSLVARRCPRRLWQCCRGW